MNRAINRRQAGIALLAAPASALSLPALAAADSPLWRSRFADGLSDWGRLSSAWGTDNHRWFTEPGVPGRALSVQLRKGSIDPGSMTRRGLPRSGTGFKARVIAGGCDAATLGYWVRFPADFQFVRGGKLPGLMGGSAPSGGAMPNGSDGFSLRLMWRTGGAGEVYAYLPTSVTYGTSLMRGAFRFVPGRWHHIAQQVVLNTPGRADGVVRMRLDGQPAGEATGLRMRDVATLRLDGIFFDLFFGGSDDTWAAAADTQVDFAEFQVFGHASANL